ncbi:pyridoxamine 5'-phosphate oxidase [Salinibius halmophilus]|uniref:pyridoxamine 5'-phosphate oxidase n=1 Tax=Salinibius halmophilus TaxID=1853216 RepID=UPI000E664C85|nr:pyridoxamine 5'-phosphate oxidase [Salinibius halmophilus]
MKLDDIRREYTQAGLNREDLADHPIDQFEQWLRMAVDANLNSDPTAMTLATVNNDGQPSQRVVLLKELDDEGFTFYTNFGSRKAQDMANNSKVSLHFGWLQLERQVIVYGEAEKLSMKQISKYFMSRPTSSRLGAWASHQSQKIGSRKLLEQAFEQAKRKFADGEIPVPDFWGGYKVKPTAIEFWQGRESRLHDRFMYRLVDGTWQVDRLQP